MISCFGGFALSSQLLFRAWLALCVSHTFAPPSPDLHAHTHTFGRLRAIFFCMLCINRPRDEKNRMTEPKTFANFQLPLKSPYAWGTICKQYDWQVLARPWLTTPQRNTLIAVLNSTPIATSLQTPHGVLTMFASWSGRCADGRVQILQERLAARK